MAEENPAAAPKSKKVSPARHAVSLVLLLIAGVVCVIELRAGLGHMLSAKALAAKADDGEFTDLPLKEARGMMKLAPKETIEDRGPDQVVRFEWFSLLRPLLQQSNPRIIIVASASSDAEPMAMAFTTVEEDPEVANRAPSEGGAPGMPNDEMSPGMGGGETQPGAQTSSESAATGSDPVSPPESFGNGSAPTESPAVSEDAAKPADQ